MENYRSTFPLNDAAIARQALRQVLLDPITWVPLVPAVAAYTIFDVPAFISLVFGAVVLGGVGAYWRKRWNGIMEELRRKKITDHNRAQNAILAAAADELRLAGSTSYAQKLEEFIEIKRGVEQRLHEDGVITSQKVQLEQLIDSLCFGVRDQLSTLAQKEKNREPIDRKAALKRVDEAYETLRTTVSEIDTILGPAVAPGGASSASIEEVTRRLREETEIARRVQARLRAEETTPVSSEPPKMESE
jgi:hypothetical protein